jgi:predicted membrane protein
MFIFIYRLIIIYLIYKLVTILIRKAFSYYLAYKEMKKRQRSQAVNFKQDVNLRAFEIEDAHFEEVKPKPKD